MPILISFSTPAIGAIAYSRVTFDSNKGLDCYPMQKKAQIAAFFSILACAETFQALSADIASFTLGFPLEEGKKQPTNLCALEKQLAAAIAKSPSRANP